MTQISTGGYVRHRDRMVQESVFQDLVDTLIGCRWMSGTTGHPVVAPWAMASGYQEVTTAPTDVLKLIRAKREDGSRAEVKVIDYFPEAGGSAEVDGTTRKTEPNTLAVDTGVAQEPQLMELGSNMTEQMYVFTMALYAESDGLALAVLNDLRDRYAGRIIRDDHLNLYNFNDPAYDESTPPVTRMDIEAFRFQLSEDASVAPWEAHLYFAELTITDYVDPAGAMSISPAEPVAVTGTAGIGL